MSFHRGVAQFRICLPEHLVAGVTRDRRMQREEQWWQVGRSGRWAQRVSAAVVGGIAVADVNSSEGVRCGNLRLIAGKSLQGIGGLSLAARSALSRDHKGECLS